MLISPGKLRRTASAALHNWAIRGVLGTPPLRRDPSGPLYVGMVCHRDALSWLVALKSIAASVGDGDWLALDDGTLTEADRATLAAHLPGLQVMAVAAVDTTGFPRGGAWERLLTILDHSGARYVVQVDADLVAAGPLPEVAAAVRANRAFTLSGEPGVALRSVAAASEAARQQTYDHVQHAAERLLADLPGADRLRYVRGCAGFAGFPRGTGKALVTMLSANMRERLGARWDSWGTEQFASNFVIAATDDPVVLPWPRYPAFRGNPGELAGAALVHFIGTHRYKGGAFRRMSRAAVARLQAGPTGSQAVPQASDGAHD